MPHERQHSPPFFATSSYQSQGQIAEIGRMLGKMRSTIQDALGELSGTAPEATLKEPNIHLLLEMMILAEATADGIDCRIAGLCQAGNRADRHEDYATVESIARQAATLTRARQSLSHLERRLESFLADLPPVLSKYRCRSSCRVAPYSQDGSTIQLDTFLEYVDSTVKALSKAITAATAARDFQSVEKLASFASLLNAFEVEMYKLVSTNECCQAPRQWTQSD